MCLGFILAFHAFFCLALPCFTSPQSSSMWVAKASPTRIANALWFLLALTHLDHLWCELQKICFATCIALIVDRWPHYLASNVFDMNHKSFTNSRHFDWVMETFRCRGALDLELLMDDTDKRWAIRRLNASCDYSDHLIPLVCSCTRGFGASCMPVGEQHEKLHLCQ